MTLTDEQIRSLRAEAEGAIFFAESREKDEPTWARDVLALVEEVERLRGAVEMLGVHLQAGAVCEMDLIAERNALAAKAEAGKGLAGYAWHFASCASRKPTSPIGTLDLVYPDCDCGPDAALARWEAANG